MNLIKKMNLVEVTHMLIDLC